MACYYCRHFNKDELLRLDGQSIIDSVRKVEGECTLSPTWQTVTGLHYCSQFSPKSAGIVGQFWTRMHEGWDAEKAERERRIAAEKKLKQLRSHKEDV